MSKYRTTTASLPADVRDRFEIVGVIQGGPRFALPHYGITQVDFSRITLQDAERLLAAGFPHIRRHTEPPAEVKRVNKRKVG